MNADAPPDTHFLATCDGADQKAAVVITDLLRFDGWRIRLEKLERGNSKPKKSDIEGLLNSCKAAIVFVSRANADGIANLITLLVEHLTKCKKPNLILVLLEDVFVPTRSLPINVINGGASLENWQRLRDLAAVMHSQGSHIIDHEETGVAIGPNLALKLAHLNQMRSKGVIIPIALLGGIYLDFHVRPVCDTVLTGDEYTNLDPIHITLGGSSVYVGRYLKSIYGKESYLVSIVSGFKNDLLAKHCLALLEAEGWIADASHILRGQLAPATTVVLDQAGGSFNTMYTHKGVLGDLTWDIVLPSLQKILEKGGILYLSSFFKTNLWRALPGNLRKFKNSIVIMDHGRLMPNIDNKNTLRAMVSAFEEKCVDVYICTFRELWDVVAMLNNDQREVPEDVEAELHYIAEARILPHVTYVRSRRLDYSTGADRYEAFCIYGNEVIRLHPDHGAGGAIPIKPTSVVKNVFNAAILSEMASISELTDIRKYFVKAGAAALEQCQDRA